MSKNKSSVPTYREIGKVLGISHERVRQIEKEALRKLGKSYSARKRLYIYYACM